MPYSTPPQPRVPLLQLNIYSAGDPVLAAAQGGCLLAQSPEFARGAITKAEWHARGAEACSKLETYG